MGYNLELSFLFIKIKEGEMRMKKKFLCVALSAMMLLPAVPIHAKQNTTINKTFITLPKKNSYTLKIKGTKKKVKWSSSKKKL